MRPLSVVWSAHVMRPNRELTGYYSLALMIHIYFRFYLQVVWDEGSAVRRISRIENSEKFVGMNHGTCKTTQHDDRDKNLPNKILL